VMAGVRNQGEIEVIARIWKGWTTQGNASAYEELFRYVVLPKVTQGISGYISTNLLRRESGEEVEFTTIFWFESLDAKIVLITHKSQPPLAAYRA